MRRRTWRYVFYVVGLAIAALLLCYVVEETAKGSEVEVGSQQVSPLSVLNARIGELLKDPDFARQFRNSQTGWAMDILIDVIDRKREMTPQLADELKKKMCASQMRETWQIVLLIKLTDALFDEQAFQQNKDAKIKELECLLDKVFEKAKEDLRLEKCKSAEALEKLRQCQKDKDEALERARKFESQNAELKFQLQKAQKDLLEKDELLKCRDGEIARLKEDLRLAQESNDEKDKEIARLSALLAEKQKPEKPQIKVAEKQKEKPKKVFFSGGVLGKTEIFDNTPYGIIVRGLSEHPIPQYGFGEIGGRFFFLPGYEHLALSGFGGGIYGKESLDIYLGMKVQVIIKNFSLAGGVLFLISGEDDPRLFIEAGNEGLVSFFCQVMPERNREMVRIGLRFMPF